MFAPFGEILNAVIMKNDNGASKGFGFVSFVDPTHAKLALDQLKDNEGLYVAKALKKEERQK